MFEPVIQIKDLNKIYKGGFKALKDVNLEIGRGEIFGLLGPNGAGKTTLINIISGLSRKTSGDIKVFGKDVERDYRFTRSKIGLVQQEISFDPFFSVWDTVKLQGGYFGLTKTDKRVEGILKDLNLLDKKNSFGRTLSGGMKRRVMIAKALVHDPEIIFLDEPTAGVDVELRKNLWSLVGKLKEMRKTIILTTHYLEEAEELADRIGVINDGRIVMVEEKSKLLANGADRLNDIYTKILEKDRAMQSL